MIDDMKLATIALYALMKKTNITEIEITEALYNDFDKIIVVNTDYENGLWTLKVKEDEHD